MNREEIIEQLQLYLLNELNEDEKQQIEKLISEDDQVKTEYEDLKKLFDSFEKAKPAEIEDYQLNRYRSELLAKVESKHRASLVNKFNEWIDRLYLSGYKAALGGAMMLVIGVLVGYAVFGGGQKPVELMSEKKGVEIDDFEDMGIDIDKIRLTEMYPENGKVSVSFEAVKPFTYTGSVEDKFIQKLMATALVKAQNPGLKIKTVNTLAAQVNGEFKPDPEVKQALIASLKVDENAGVRRAALNLLTSYSFDEEIRDAILYVLENDKNSGMRVAAINALSGAKLKDGKFDNKVLEELSKWAESDQNNFVKHRAAILLEGEK